MRHMFHHACVAYCGNLGGLYYYPKPANNLEMKFSKPTLSRVYIQWLKWFAAHPKATRREFLLDFYGDVINSRRNARIAFNKKHKGKIIHCVSNDPRAYFNPSSYFAILLYRNYLDYDKKFRYRVTAKGMRLIAAAEAVS